MVVMQAIYAPVCLSQWELQLAASCSCMNGTCDPDCYDNADSTNTSQIPQRYV